MFNIIITRYGGEIMEKKQMKLPNFCKEYDIPRTTILKWVHTIDFPAYNLSGHWYVDIQQYYKWREKENIRSNKYA